MGERRMSAKQMLGSLVSQFLIDGAETLAGLVKTSLGADDLILDEVDGETDGADGILLHNVSFLMLLASCVFLRSPPLFLFC